ncbi:type I-E CRISPR-associated protein Cas7/Cse4/CasC [Cutibacterium sp.]|uniref:type I-E CRISPR-associated protein Cas7/Cse4/CasC n=1 Tax=Cutibacterium sp. TaxID=1912221 RepID=UPI0026DC663E|nr:type I-E CRISPR-associated protein Cas7/Cse4/CasC [Cutibacterium sp.]MDO4412395.1 type I-E CRISPR-associated protein Cas7/Cse4/CasC [Cutibacterium sp.]
MNYVDIHVIQSVPPSNVNRDDTGAPKTALYGGVRRARVSSQAWKKAVRTSFKDYLPTDQLASRTQRVVELLMNRLTAAPYEFDEDDARKRALKVVKALKLKVKAPRKSGGEGIEYTEYLVFFSNQQLDRLAQIAAKDEIKAADVKKAADSDHGIEVALFGRMLADSKDLNVDSAVQVAHALSTHAVDIESDYFTAVDDYKLDEDDAGAGMIGTIEFTSETLYRFATVAISTLNRNLGDVDLTAQAASAFVRGFVLSMPTGKQNTFGNNTIPDAVVVQIRKGRSTSFVGAFEDAVQPDGGGYVEPSCRALADYAHECEQAFLGEPVASFVTRVGTRTKAVGSMGTEMSIDDLIASVRDQVTSLLQDES